LCLASLASVALNTGPLMKLMAVKRGHTFSLSEWGRSSTWIAAISLGSAFVAGLVHLNAVRYGPGVYAVGAAVVLALAVLLRLTIGNLERERSRQEARLTIAQREAELSQQRFTAAFTHAAIGMAIVHADGRMLQVNHALCLLLGRADSDLLGHPFRDLLHPGDEALLRRHTEEITRRPDETYSMELRCDGADGQQLWVALYCSRYEDPGDAGPCLIYQLHDITSRRVAENRLHHIAFHDGLTDLANRHCFNERLELAVEESRLDDSVRFAVLFLDLDRFKIVNDSLGHIAGNTLLREVAQRLQTCVRPCDLVARLGGDEFAILLPALHDADAGLRLAQRVLDALSLSLSINGTEVVPGASVGITFSDLGYRTVDEVLRDADLAMYEAKAGGRGRVALFDISMHERAADKLALEADLRRAIGEGQLSVQFQPLYELEPYRLYGFEALARWVHPVRGPVSPAVFIALAEESGHIEALTDWVIDHSVAQLALWQRTLPDTAHLGMHVNISGRDLARADLAERVQQVLERHALAAPCLTLEITETTLMGKLDLALQTMGRLRESGVRFSIDDFGTGYSSLAYLGSLPIDSLKIDRSFVMSLHEKPQNVEIVRAILNLAQSLGRRVVAEGIETPEQLATLRRLGVHIGQGYLLSRPLRAAQIVELLSLATASAPA
jgi:diguanylate cyclase (GGDEF)-like protein/PAS domain S-box-containing protein